MTTETVLGSLRPTRVYGASDDLIEFEGGLHGEASNSHLEEDGPGYLFFSDGTILRVWYGKGEKGIWGLRVEEKGLLFDKLELCTDEDEDPYSDVATFKPGLRWAYFAPEAGLVQ